MFLSRNDLYNLRIIQVTHTHTHTQSKLYLLSICWCIYFRYNCRPIRLLSTVFPRFSFHSSVVVYHYDVADFEVVLICLVCVWSSILHCNSCNSKSYKLVEWVNCYCSNDFASVEIGLVITFLWLSSAYQWWFETNTRLFQQITIRIFQHFHCTVHTWHMMCHIQSNGEPGSYEMMLIQLSARIRSVVNFWNFQPMIVKL